MTPRQLAAAVADGLAAAGVDRLFGLPGGGPNLEKVGAAAAAGIDFVLTHGETAACIAAATYGLLTGRPGVGVVTRGPGVASAANGLAQATLDRFPLLLLSDTVSAADRPRVSHQRLDQVGLTRPLTKWSATLGTRCPRPLMAAALALAARAPAGAVHLDVDPGVAGDRPPSSPSPPTLDLVALEAAVRLARPARRPVLVVGAQAASWWREVREVAEACACPVLTTYQGVGILPDSSPCTAGLFTNGALERPLLDAADLVVLAGVDPVELIPVPWTLSAPVLAVHPWPVTDRYVEPSVAVAGPVGEALLALRPALSGDWDPEAGRRAKEAARRALAVAGPGLTPHQVVEAVLRQAPPEGLATVDAGAHMLVAMPLWPVEEPHRLLISNGLATMGFALPAAVGAALAHPGRPVTCLVGDGGLGMTLAELETVARLDLDVTVVVFNDSALSLIEIKQGPGQGGPAAVRYRPTDFAAVAGGFGIPAAVADDEAGLARALATPRRGPRLVDARVDPTAYPHVFRVTRG